MDLQTGKLTSNAVVGVGNSIRGDDGIGPYIIDLLRGSECFDDLPDTGLFNIGQDIFSLIGIIDRHKNIIILDCAMINKGPGEIHIIDYHHYRKEKCIYMPDLRSIHSLSVMDAIEIALHTCTGQKSIKIICIQGMQMNVSDIISTELKNKACDIIKTILSILGIDNAEKKRKL